MSKVNNDNYILIQGWMINELGLKNNDLLIYAVIYGFSQADGKFSGSLQYLADWVSGTKQGVLKNLNKLIEKGLIEKEESVTNGIKNCSYKTSRGIKQSLTGIKQSLTGYSTEFNGGIKQSLTNNIDNKNIDIKEKDISNDISKKKVKHKVADFVTLTDDEERKLKEKFGSQYEEKIQDLNCWKGAKGKTTKSDYFTILNWDRMHKKKEKEKPQTYGSYMDGLKNWLEED